MPVEQATTAERAVAALEAPLPTPDTEVELFSLAGRDGYLRQVNDAFARLLGRTAAEVSRLSLLELVHPEDILQTVEGIAALERGDAEVLFENRFLQPDGTTVWLQWVARPVKGGEEWWATGRDVSEFRRLLAAAVDHVARLDVAVGGSSAGCWQLDARSGLLSVDDPFLALVSLPPTSTGSPAEMAIADVGAAVQERDREQLVAALELLRTARSPTSAIQLTIRVGVEPSVRHLSLRGKTVERDRRGRPVRAVGVLLDVTAEKAMEEHLMRLVMSDPLTGLANRRSFDQTLRTELRRTERAGRPLSLLMVDIDHFKRFNDTYGHLVGDDVLCLVARALSGAVVRPGDLVSRFGGEEFAVILPDTDADAAAMVAVRALVAVRSVHLRQAPAASIAVSIGAATSGAGLTPAALLARADGALYQAKEQGRDRCVSADNESTAPG